MIHLYLTAGRYPVCHHPCLHAGGSGMGRHRTQDDRTSADYHPFADPGVSIATGLASGAKRNGLQNGNIIIYHRDFANNDPCNVVERNAADDAGRKIYIYAKNLILEINCQRLVVLIPQLTAYKKVYRVESLKIQQRRGTFMHRMEVAYGSDVHFLLIPPTFSSVAG